MFDLEEVIRFVTKIQDAGLETAPMTQIALGCGYKHATSTPFYRRMVSGRLFGLLTKSGAELTSRARDYLKPTTPGVDKKALSEAILSIQPYAIAVERFKGKKFNLDLIANGFNRDLNLTDECAAICARALESSLKFAGFLAADLTVSVESTVAVNAKQPDPEKLGRNEANPKKEVADDPETQTHTIYLDKTKQRKFEVTAPIDITAGELARAKGFLDFALIVDEDAPAKREEAAI